MSAPSQTPSMSTSRSPSPTPPAQPDHFYRLDDTPLPPSPNSDGRTWLDPEDDPLATRGIPVFKPTMEEFDDFEDYMNKIECWGNKSGIVKVIPPKQWKDALPPLNAQLAAVKIKNPIEQHMLGNNGRFRAQNIEKRRIMSVREWAELCAKDDWRAPGVDDVGLHARSSSAPKPKTRRKKAVAASPTENAEPQVKAEPDDERERSQSIDTAHDNKDHPSPPQNIPTPAASCSTPEDQADKDPSPTEGHPTATTLPRSTPEHLRQEEEEGSEDEAPSTSKLQKPKSKGRRQQTHEERQANLAQRHAKDLAFLETFDPDSDWLPPNTHPFDYTPEFCQKLERQYWRNCGFGKPALYGADMQGSLFTDETKVWNVAHLPSLLSRILPSSQNGLPGVNTPYLYFGMWRAIFAWHVEDMDLLSINYIHFGAAKFWYAVPQGRAAALEQTMKGYFPEGRSRCPQFLRHKSYLASPKMLANASCKPNTLVQNSGEFVITYPRGYHAGINLGFNCAESVNFALESWLELGRKAKVCECIGDSVRIDVDELLREREQERLIDDARTEAKAAKAQAPASRKRKADTDSSPKAKKTKAKTKPESVKSTASASSSAPRMSVTLKLPPKPKEPEPYPCCLCISMDTAGLLPVSERPAGSHSAYAEVKEWRAHEECANVLPETWVDEVEVPLPDGTPIKTKLVFGVDAIVKDRWNLKCSACTKNRPKTHGAPVQCTKGKCSKAFHVSCARDGASNNIVYRILGVVEKEIIFADSSQVMGPTHDVQPGTDAPMEVDGIHFDYAGSAPGEMAAEPQVVKTVQKIVIELLCSQHNPAVTEAKKASKQDKIRNQLLALESMARIKIRVSAGVFEVSLCRVLEETSSVEVLWDKGIKREFKWGSVVFGSLEGQTVGQKPTEPALESHLPSYIPVAFNGHGGESLGVAAAIQTAAPNLVASNSNPYANYQAAAFQYGRDTWPYYYSQQQQQQQQQQAPIAQYPQNSTYGYGQDSAGAGPSYAYASYGQPQQPQPAQQPAFAPPPNPNYQT
ncbi:hypothetical protein EWM64_g10100, partial [Hericium alpestre]